jgi:O-antigen ligase
MVAMAAATETRPAGLSPPAPRAERASDRAPARSPWLLAAALGVAVAYAAIADGSVGLPEETRLQVGVAAIAVVALAALLFGDGLRFAPERRAGLGLTLLAGFAVWCALSLTWSISPDETWVEINRAIAYALVAALAIVLGSSLPRAAERVALGYFAIATAISLYAVAGKVAPWLAQHAVDISRLRAPLDYWNALALFCVLAVPVGLQAAADGRYSPRRRMAALLALLPLLLTIALTYSRGGIAVLVVALVVQIALARDKWRLAAHAGVAAAAIVPALLVAVMRDDLTTDRLTIAARSDDGLLLGFGLLLGAVGALFAGRQLLDSHERLEPDPARRPLARRAALAAALAGLIVLVPLTASGWVGDQIDSFTDTRSDRTSDPSRVLQVNSGNRWVWWNEAAGAAWDQPVTGHGAGSFPLLHLLYREDNLEVRQPHSVPLEFLSETGLIGAGLGLGGLALLLMAGLSRTRWRVGGERAYAAALAGGAVAWSAHLWFDWDWDVPGVALPGLIFLGVLAAAPADEPRPPSPPARGGRALALAGAAALLALFTVSAVLPALAREKTSQAFDALQEAAGGRPGDLPEGAEAAALARRLDPFSVEPLLAAAGIAERRGQTELAAELLVDAVERQPDNPRVWVRLARLQVLLGDIPAGLRSTRAVLELDPHSVAGLFAVVGSAYDERTSASATGTPLPVLVRPVLPLIPEVPSPSGALPPAPAPVTPPAAPAPTPPVAPPAPPPPPPPPEGEPFRLEG